MSCLEELLKLSTEDISRLALAPVKVAVLDSGIDATLSVLRGRVINSCVNADFSGHGTAVAGLIAENAGNAQLIDCKVLDEYNRCDGACLLEALEHAIASEAKIINLSLTCRRKYRMELMDLCDKAYACGKIVVAAKRNIPLADDNGFPAELATCIGVEPSSFPQLLKIRYTGYPPIEFAANGENLRVHLPGGATRLQSGSSFAVPLVTSRLSLYLGLNPDLTVFELKTLLKHQD